MFFDLKFLLLKVLLIPQNRGGEGRGGEGEGAKGHDVQLLLDIFHANAWGSSAFSGDGR